MAQYCDNFDLIQEQFDQFGINDTSDSFKTWLGLRGPQGPQGEPGSGLEIKDVVETLADLPTSAAQGDVYLVGTASPYVAYIWNNGAWLNLGEVAVGPAGPQGPPGEQGQDGRQGEDGTTFTPSVSEAGVISWTNDGGKQNPDLVNIKGPAGERGATGEQGPAGNDGAAATIAVGTVSGLPAGSTPTIVNSGTSSSAVFDFGIPAGATGPQGATGPGVASGGSAGQVLAKASGTDYDTEWVDRAPVNHASPSQTYGVGNYSNYGHVKLADTPSASMQAGDGYAATPAAVQAAVNKATWTLLWQNASPTSAFAAQTIPFSYTDYDFLAIVIRNHKDAAVQQTIFFQAVNGGGVASSKSTLISNGMYFQYREGYLNDSGLAMANAMEGSVERSQTVYPVTANYVLIPVAVYGLKNL